ncbi:hypothetical protein EGM70_14765 [Enterobacteriaceae bacterium 89]|nr:hypothetical protein [Enterobacteriaceae bacterium 89]
MEASPVWTHPLLYVDVEPETDFIATIVHCEKLAADAMETEHTTTQHDLYQRLHQCLSALRPTLLDPIPEELEAQFTVSTLPAHPPAMETESDQLCDYCLALSELLCGKRMTLDVEETLKGLLYDLTCFLSDTMQAPRWLKTPLGNVPL